MSASVADIETVWVHFLAAVFVSGEAKYGTIDVAFSKDRR